MLVLRQSTAIDIRMGPFVDATDGVVPETGITLGTADQAEVLKENGAATVAMAGTFAAVTGADGWYDYTVASGDVDTVGEVVFVVQDSSVCLPVFVRAMVVEENVYDAIYDAGSALGTDIANILTDTGTTLDTAITNIDTKVTDLQGVGFTEATHSNVAIRVRGDAAWTGGATTTDSGTAQAGAAGSITLQSGASAIDSTYVGQVVLITAGEGVGQSRAIDGYTGSSKIATVITNWATTPNATSVYEVYPDDITEVLSAPTAAAVADAVWDENTAGHTTGGTFGEQVKNDIDAILVDTSTTLDGAISAMQGNVTDILADTNELQGDWVDSGRLDALIDQILVDTNDIETQIGAAGAGLTAVPWNSAWDAQVESECNDALVAMNLDHVALTPVGSSDVVDNTIVAKLVSASATADWDDFVNTTDSLQAIRDKSTDIEADTADIQTRLPAALIGGRMDSNVEAVNNVVIVGDGSGTPFDV